MAVFCGFYVLIPGVVYDLSPFKRYCTVLCSHFAPVLEIYVKS